MGAGGLGTGNASIMKNRIINGAMVISQRWGTTAVSDATNTNPYLVDRWSFYGDPASKVTLQQNQGSVTPPAGFVNYMGLTSSSAYTPAAGDAFRFQQIIEGFNIADLNWGTANAKTVTLSFWVRSSLTGTFGGALSNSALNRSYPFTFTISAANTWEYETITIAGDTSGTWLTTNGAGIRVFLDMGCGSTTKGPAGAWASAFYAGATGGTNVVSTNGATFQFTGVQLEVGSSATGYEYRQVTTELQLCQRYYEKSFDYDTNPTSAIAAGGAYGLYTTSGSAGGLTTAYLDGYVGYRVEKRTGPSISSFDEAGNAGKCTRISPGVLATSNQLWSAGSAGTTGFTTTSISGASAGRISFYWTSNAEL
jgi:hypothetical protein